MPRRCPPRRGVKNSAQGETLGRKIPPIEIALKGAPCKGVKAVELARRSKTGAGIETQRSWRQP